MYTHTHGHKSIFFFFIKSNTRFYVIFSSSLSCRRTAFNHRRQSLQKRGGEERKKENFMCSGRPSVIDSWELAGHSVRGFAFFGRITQQSVSQSVSLWEMQSFIFLDSFPETKTFSLSRKCARACF